MSFYGNVTYYLSNAFNRVIYRNKNSMNSPSDGAAIGKDKPQNPSYEYALSPRSRNDDTILETGNKWIVFADPYATVGNNQVQIFHQTVRDNQEDVHVEPFNRAVNENEGSIINMDFGSIIGIPSITYDNAGHIVQSGVDKFKLPVPAGETALNQLKMRISQIEEDLSGSHYEDDAEIDSLNDVQPNNSYASRIGVLENRTNKWTIGGASGEQYGIGTTLREFLADFGLRVRETGTDPTNYTYRVLGRTEDYPDGSYLQKIQLATSNANNASFVANEVRKAYNDMADALNNANIAGGGFRKVEINSN